MNPLGIVARIVIAAALLVALVMSFVPSFLVVSFDTETAGVDISAGASAWNGLGVLGGLGIMVGLPVSVIAAALPNRVPVARRVLAGVAGGACLAAAMVFVLYLLIEIKDLPDGMEDLNLGLGWSGYATLAALVVGAVAAVVATVLPDRPTAPAVPPPLLWS